MTFSCIHCDNHFNTKEAKQEHTKNNHITNISKPKKINFSEVNCCPQCEKVFKTEALLNQHLDIEHMDTELNETVETPTSEAVTKTSQFHCALSIYSPDTPECSFQCDTKLELDNHIKINHNFITFNEF